MTSQTDRYGLPLSTDSPHAADAYREGVDLMLSSWPNAGDRLDAAIGVDPDFALALAARARLHAICAQPALARPTITEAVALADRHGTERERSHVRVLSAVIHGQPDALTQALAHADRWPTDVLILGLMMGAFGLFAFSGMADHDQARVDLCERHARHFAADDWWFLTYRGWSHGEHGQTDLGRGYAERALALRPANANAAHGLVHVLIEGGAFADAGRLLDDWLPGYDRSGVLHGHLAWHGALLALADGDVERALAWYTGLVAPSVSHGLPINVVSDSASFLWRLQVYGYPVPEGLWVDAARYAARHYPKPGLAFIELHLAMLAAATGDATALHARERQLAERVTAGALPAGPVMPVLCRALLAFAEGRFADCAAALAPVLPEVARIGGSGAQREVIEDTLIIARMRAGQADAARALLERRLQRRDSPLDRRWRASLGQGAH